MLKEFSIKTRAKIDFHEITPLIEKTVQSSGVKQGVCYIFVPHTTAAVTINENADPSVEKDITRELGRLVPDSGQFLHREGNSPAHIKASLLGAEEVILVENGRLLLGTWQGVFFCEFDGPRQRRVWVKIVEG